MVGGCGRPGETGEARFRVSNDWHANPTRPIALRSEFHVDAERTGGSPLRVFSKDPAVLQELSTSGDFRAIGVGRAAIGARGPDGQEIDRIVLHVTYATSLRATIWPDGLLDPKAMLPAAVAALAGGQLRVQATLLAPGDTPLRYARNTTLSGAWPTPLPMVSGSETIAATGHGNIFELEVRSTAASNGQQLSVMSLVQPVPPSAMTALELVASPDKALLWLCWKDDEDATAGTGVWVAARPKTKNGDRVYGVKAQWKHVGGIGVPGSSQLGEVLPLCVPQGSKAAVTATVGELSATTTIQG